MDDRNQVSDCAFKAAWNSSFSFVGALPWMSVQPVLGQIAEGSEADIAVFRLEKGTFGFADVIGGRIEGSQRLGCEMTLRAGKIVYDLNARAAVPWGTGDLKYPVK